MLPKGSYGRFEAHCSEKEVERISILRQFLSVREINVNLQLTKYCRLKTVVKAFFCVVLLLSSAFQSTICNHSFRRRSFLRFCPVLILSESINRQMF